MIHRKWWVLRVLPQQELIAERLVKRLGYQAMVPYVERWVRRTPRSPHKRLWKQPLFPSYLFASWDHWQEGWYRVRGKLNPMENISSIYDFLAPISVPMPYILPPADVEYLESISDGKYRPEEPVRKLVVGDKVLIPEGWLAGQTGIAMEISGKNITIEVKSEEKTHKIKMPLAKVEKV